MGIFPARRHSNVWKLTAAFENDKWMTEVSVLAFTEDFFYGLQFKGQSC